MSVLAGANPAPATIRVETLRTVGRRETPAR